MIWRSLHSFMLQPITKESQQVTDHVISSTFSNQVRIPTRQEKHSNQKPSSWKDLASKNTINIHEPK